MVVQEAIAASITNARQANTIVLFIFFVVFEVLKYA